MNDDRALAYLKMMGFDDDKASEMIVGPASEFHKGLLNEMEAGIRHLAGDSSVDPVKVFQKVNNLNLLGDGKNNR